MDIIVCVKQVPDPNIPAAKFKVTDNAVAIPEGLPPVLNPYDVQAVEAGLRLKEKNGGKVTAISIGGSEAIDAVRYALSMGADSAVAVDQGASALDSFDTAGFLVQAIKKLGKFDLILCGREGVDWNMGLVGPFIAEELGLPLISLAKSLELLGNGFLKVERVSQGSTQVFEVPPPAIVTISNEIGLPRLPSGWGIIKAARQQIPVWSDIIQSQQNELPKPQRLKLYVPERARQCELVTGESPAEIATKLIAKLKSTGLI